MSQHPHPTRDWTIPTLNSPGGGQYYDATNSAQMYPCFPDAGHPTAVYNASKRPQYNSSHPPTSPPPPHGFYSMASNVPSQSGVAATASPQSDPRAAKRVKTNSPQSVGFPTFAIPAAPTPQSQAAAAAAAEAHRLRMAQAAASGQSLPGFSHPPTELPPRPYDSRASPFTPSKPPGKITGSQMQYLPDIEARLNRLESAVDKYVEIRGQKAVENSKLPGSSQQQQRK